MKEINLLPKGMSIRIANYMGGINFYKKLPNKEIKYTLSYPKGVDCKGTISNTENVGEILLAICDAYRDVYNVNNIENHSINQLHIEGLWLDTETMELIIAVGS